MPSLSTEPELLPSGPNGFITFMYYFGLTSLILSLPIARFLHLDLGTSLPYQYALVLGVMGGGWGTYFNRSVTLQITHENPQEILAKLESQLNELGFFTECEQKDGIWVYSPPILQSFFMGKIRVLIQEKQIKIVGRAIHLRELQKGTSIN